MRRVAFAVAAAALSGTAHASQQWLTAEYIESNLESMWASFKATHRKSYSSDEETRRRVFFKKNMHQAAAAQKLNPEATFGVTRFSDLSDEEWSAYRGGLKPESQTGVLKNAMSAEEVERKLKRAVTSVDMDLNWNTNAHVVTPVKDQGQCGGCWAFAAVGAIESAWARSLNPLTSLSEQFLISCGRGDGPLPAKSLGPQWSAGDCSGGLPRYAFEYLLAATGGSIVSEADYPYVATNAECAYTTAMPWAATINNFTRILPVNDNTEHVMLASLELHGPITVGINSDPIKSYTGGVLTTCEIAQPDHAVLIVGYGHATGTGTRYWTIKNSWGTSFGESGYFRIKFGENLCNINHMATFVSVDLPAPVPGLVEVPIAQPDPVPAVAPAAERLPYLPPGEMMAPGGIPDSPQDKHDNGEFCVSGSDCQCKASWLSWMGLEGKKVGNVCAPMLILAGVAIVLFTCLGVCAARVCCADIVEQSVYQPIRQQPSPTAVAIAPRPSAPPPRGNVQGGQVPLAT